MTHFLWKPTLVADSMRDRFFELLAGRDVLVPQEQVFRFRRTEASIQKNAYQP